MEETKKQKQTNIKQNKKNKSLCCVNVYDECKYDNDRDNVCFSTKLTGHLVFEVL